MNFEKIHHEQVKKLIEELFHIAPKTKWALQPEAIVKLAASAGVRLEWRDLGWEAIFETEEGYQERTFERFKNTLFAHYEPGNGPVVITPDISFIKQDFSFLIDSRDLEEFVNETFPGMYNVDFIEPIDYVFYFPEDKYLILIHHHDEIAEYRSSI